jgi:hypothetical protein
MPRSASPDPITALILNWYGDGMAYTQKDMSGSLFKNDKKDNDKQPNAKGACMVEGVEYWVSAWTKKDKNGNPWQSLAFSKKETQRPEGKRPSQHDVGDDDTPF